MTSIDVIELFLLNFIEKILKDQNAAYVENHTANQIGEIVEKHHKELRYICGRSVAKVKDQARQKLGCGKEQSNFQKAEL